MVWAPNIGTSYPWAPNDRIPVANSPDPLLAANFITMNTNAAGASATVIDNTDDPYTPYYPGDIYVDWVALSIYNYGQQVTVPGTLANYMSPANPLHDFYGIFSAGKNKPFMLGETGSSFRPGTDELAIKESWWKEIFATLNSGRFPLFKAAIWFEEIKSELNFAMSEEIVNDYRITFSDPIKTAFVNDVTPINSVLWGEQMTYSCSGFVGPKNT